MSTVSPTATSPIRSRVGNTRDHHFGWHRGNDYDPGLSPHGRGPPPPPHQGAPRLGYFRSPHDSWPPEPQGGGYWGPPPAFEGSRSTERFLPPLSRGPPSTHPFHHHHRSSGAQYNDQEHQVLLRRTPSSPSRSYSRGSHQMKIEGRKLQSPRRAPSSSKSKKDGDALSILANVSADMDGNDAQEAASEQHLRQVPMPAPTSPLQRRARASPITPNHTPQDRNRIPRPQVTPISANRLRDPHFSAWEQIQDSRYGDCPPLSYQPPKRRGFHPQYREYGAAGYHDGSPPVIVEHGGSFDSQGDPSPYSEYPYMSTPPTGPYYYDDHPRAFGGYWEAGAQNHHASYVPPRWNYGPPVDTYSPEYLYEGHDDASTVHRPPLLSHAAPYTYVQQPRLEEKTILKKKFSWKHYPELERFLIANRDEYLKHSNMNYTAEQKQYNNWLTERLLEVAEHNHYVFDPEDFNFVAIRDRIRCYYKSYVQTARKRGLKLPEKKKD
eukprot:scaffold3450_cov114-Cylindrotheca_fusiformis.AAC.25